MEQKDDTSLEQVARRNIKLSKIEKRAIFWQF